MGREGPVIMKDPESNCWKMWGRVQQSRVQFELIVTIFIATLQ